MGFPLPSRPRLLSLNRPPPSHRSPKKRRGAVTQPLFCLGCLARQRPPLPQPKSLEMDGEGEIPSSFFERQSCQAEKGKGKDREEESGTLLIPNPRSVCFFSVPLPGAVSTFSFPLPSLSSFSFSSFFVATHLRSLCLKTASGWMGGWKEGRWRQKREDPSAITLLLPFLLYFLLFSTSSVRPSASLSKSALP